MWAFCQVSLYSLNPCPYHTTIIKAQKLFCSRRFIYIPTIFWLLWKEGSTRTENLCVKYISISNLNILEKLWEHFCMIFSPKHKLKWRGSAEYVAFVYPKNNRNKKIRGCNKILQYLHFLFWSKTKAKCCFILV